MNGIRDTWQRHRWFKSALATLALLACAPATGLAAERVVLGEEFTATW